MNLHFHVGKTDGGPMLNPDSMDTFWELKDVLEYVAEELGEASEHWHDKQGYATNEAEWHEAEEWWTELYAKQLRAKDLRKAKGGVSNTDVREFSGTELDKGLELDVWECAFPDCEAALEDLEDDKGNWVE
jgi:hypothetical protein